MNENSRMDTRQSNSSARPLSIQGASNSDGLNPPPQPLPNQPRQPTNLQGLLKYTLEAAISENAENKSQALPLDEESKTFLNNALSSLTVNITEELQEVVRFLSNIVSLSDDDDPCEYESALEKISHYVDNIDIANDFYKIGGFSVLKPCLDCSHSSIRWRTADIIAELAQNNPFCQEKMLEAELLPVLLSMVDADTSEQARIKALYAVSCIVRGNLKSLKHMDTHDGYSVLLRAMQSPVQKLQIKSAFLLSSLCSRENSNDVKYTLLKMGFIEQAAGLLPRYDLQPGVREQLLRMLCAITSDNFSPALEECRLSRHCLKAILEEILNELKQSGENQDEIDLCLELLEKVFSVADTNHPAN